MRIGRWTESERKTHFFPSPRWVVFTVGRTSVSSCPPPFGFLQETACAVRVRSPPSYCVVAGKILSSARPLSGCRLVMSMAVDRLPIAADMHAVFNCCHVYYCSMLSM
ncbi:unnamed protein product [Ostreobium quekettii]|uniref:Uncharacterized protein n=1 Tax=Ostreobium quekettii TaxID=121088 RepID=A0A8S1IYJ9_9CHLO|nr:unnamed protein product [Ostreobium quekettii]